MYTADRSHPQTPELRWVGRFTEPRQQMREPVSVEMTSFREAGGLMTDWRHSGVCVAFASLLAAMGSLFLVYQRTVHADAPILAGRWHFNEITSGITAD